MCAGALLQARVSELVYGVPDERGGAAGSIVDLLDQPAFNHRVAVRSGLLAEEARALMQAFFQPRREN
jgi:tRNA(adenine34) deaminase